MPQAHSVRSLATDPRISEYRISAVISGSLAKSLRSARTDVALRIRITATIQITLTIFFT